MGHPYRETSFKEPLKMTSLHVEYKPVPDTHLAARWVLWLIGIALTGEAGRRFVIFGHQEPETQRIMIVVGIYWFVWFARYVSISLRHVGD